VGYFDCGEACGGANIVAAGKSYSNADRKLSKVISPVDLCSAWTAKANKRVQFGYGAPARCLLVSTTNRLSAAGPIPKARLTPALPPSQILQIRFFTAFAIS
jgi:hypothetical protein